MRTQHDRTARTWTISEGEQSFGLKLGTDFDYAAMPQYGNNQKFASENGWSLAVSSSCKEQEIALKFLEYLYQDDVMLEHNIRCTQIPAKKSLAQSEEYKKRSSVRGRSCRNSRSGTVYRKL